MNTDKVHMGHIETRLRFVLVFILVFIVSFSTISSSSILNGADMDKIEKLADGETNIDVEEIEKNIEGEEEQFINSRFEKYNFHLDGSTRTLNNLKISLYQSKIPTPPPDFL